MYSDTADGSRPVLHTEQIVAIVVSCLAVLGAAAVLLFMLIRRKLRSQNQRQQREQGHHQRNYSYEYEKAKGRVFDGDGKFGRGTGAGEEQFKYPSHSNTLPSFKHLRQPSDQVQLLQPPSPPYVRQLSDTSPRPPSPRPSTSTPQAPSSGTVQQPPPSYIHSHRDVVSPDIYYM